MAQQPSEDAESGTVLRGLPAGLPHQRARSCVPPASSWRSRRRRWRATPTTTRPSASTRRRRRTRSRRRTASSRASTTRTRTRTPARRSASRRSPRPTTSCRTPRSARSTTAAACSAARPGRSAPAARRAARAAPTSARSPTSSRGSSTRAAAAARARGRRPSAGATSRPPSPCSFEQAVEGAQVPVSVATHSACPTCRGTGAEPGTQPVVCPVCHGRGVESQGQGLFSITRPCERCGGSGTVIEQPCHTCHGEGRMRELKKYRVNIPAGVKDGSRIRLAGKGEAGLRGGPAGDLFVVTHVERVARVPAQGRQLRGRGPDHGGRGARRAPTSRSRRCTARRRCACRPARGTAPSSACAARARRSRAASGKGDLRYRFVIDVPQRALRRAEARGRRSSRRS